MKTKVQKFTVNSFFLLHSSSSANTLYVENKEDHQLFISLLNRYLAEMIEICQYWILPKGWKIIFRTKSEKQIRKTYLDWRRKSKKAIKSFAKENPLGTIIFLQPNPQISIFNWNNQIQPT